MAAVLGKSSSDWPGCTCYSGSADLRSGWPNSTRHIPPCLGFRMDQATRPIFAQTTSGPRRSAQQVADCRTVCLSAWLRACARLTEPCVDNTPDLWHVHHGEAQPVERAPLSCI